MSTTTTTTTTLRDHLLHALSSHPGTRELHVHALVSAPRKTSSLYPFATPRPPRAYMQDILVLLSEQPLLDDAQAAAVTSGSNPGAATSTSTTSTTSTTRPPRVLISAIEATLYVLPSTSCCVLYISKVDSTGQAAHPSPTALLVRSLLAYYVDPRTRPVPRAHAAHMYVHVFARAQAQYLFSASKEWPGKKPLGDTQLCAWWRRCLGRVVADVAAAHAHPGGTGGGGGLRVNMYYVLPGYSELEAEHALRIASPASAAPVQLPGHLRWVYGHPYSQTDGTPLPCPPPPDMPSQGSADADADKKKKASNNYGNLNLGCIIPSFDDDPKSRFMDEIAYTTDGDIKSPQRKRAKTITSTTSKAGATTTASMPTIATAMTMNTTGHEANAIASSSSLDEERNANENQNQEAAGGGSSSRVLPDISIKEDKDKGGGNGAGSTNSTTEDHKPLGELGKVTPDEFWERMSFRQECIAGAVTGFFTVVVSLPAPSDPSRGSFGPGPGTGASTTSMSTVSPLAPQAGQVSGQVNKRIMTTLLTGVEFSTFERAVKATETVEGAIKGLCEGMGRVPTENNMESGRRTPERVVDRLEVPRTPPRRRREGKMSDVSPNPFPEPVASLDTYYSYIYGSTETRNAGVRREAEEARPAAAVTVLAVRKKKKRLL